MMLNEVRIGGRVAVTNLRAEGAERRRLLDLGFSIGAVVETVRMSPLGDPVAYRVRGSTVALRREQAERIEVRPC
jgi:ferrous iron transport protein A